LQFTSSESILGDSRIVKAEHAAQTQTGGNVIKLNKLLNITIQELNANFAYPAQIQVDIWKLLNWIYVVQYWSLLYDVGQVQPTIYTTPIGNVSDIYIPNKYSATNNFFINSTFFTICEEHFVSIILPLLEVVDGVDYGNYTLQSLSSNNVLEPVDVAFNLAYSIIFR